MATEVETSIDSIIKQGLIAQKRTAAGLQEAVNGLFDFAKCVVDLKSHAKTRRGGTDFTNLARDK